MNAPWLPLLPGAVTALVIVDMQEFFFRLPERRLRLDQMVLQLNRCIDFCDARDWPVVHVASAFQADGSDWDLKMKAAGAPELIQGSPEARFLSAVHIASHHHTLIKTRYSAFFKTRLAQILHSLDVARVMVAGAYTHYCVNATVFDAYAYDFVPGVLTDAVISHLPEESRLMIERMRRNGYHVLSTAEFVCPQPA